MSNMTFPCVNLIQLGPSPFNPSTQCNKSSSCHHFRRTSWKLGSQKLLLHVTSTSGNFNSAELHFECSFQGYPTCLSFCISGGQVAGGTKKIGKWGIPEKSIQNVAQLRWNYLRRTLQSKVMAENRVLGNRPLYFTLLSGGVCYYPKNSKLGNYYTKNCGLYCS